MGGSTDGGRPANAACNGRMMTEFRGTALTGYRDAYDWGLAKGRMSPLYLTCCQDKPYLCCQAAVPEDGMHSTSLGTLPGINTQVQSLQCQGTL